jgi:hypothetical protein
MIRFAAILICMFAGAVVAFADSAPSAPSSAAVDRAAIAALATTYTFGVSDEPLLGCIVKLKPALKRSKGRSGRPVEINEQCHDRFPALSRVTRWEPTGGGSIRLLGGKPYQELSDFSPVQDATGVYLRGGFKGDKAIYELRPPQ